MPELTLYYFPSCPYCRLVLDCLESLGPRDSDAGYSVRAWSP